jgi:hypothetical protein
LKKKIFILEDDHNRIDWFNYYLSDFDLIICETYQDAIEKYHGDFDLLMLDHDLGGEIFVDSFEREDTGAGFCRWLVSHYPKDVPVIIHSHNIIGAEIMEETLRDECFTNVLKIPFGHFTNQFLNGDISLN